MQCHLWLLHRLLGSTLKHKCSPCRFLRFRACRFLLLPQRAKAAPGPVNVDNKDNMTQLATKIVADGDRLIVGRSQDCTAIAEHTKALHNEGYHGSADVKHAAKIPLVIVEKYLNDNGVTFEQFMSDQTHIKRLVQHPDNSMFRIWKGAF